MKQENKPKKILVITNIDIGLYNFRKEVLDALLAEGYEIHIALPDGDFIPKLTQMGCIFHETQMERRGMNPKQELQLIRRYQEIIRKVQPDVAMTYTIKPNVYGGLCLTRAKVPFITNITGLGTALEGDGILPKVMTILYRLAMRGVRCLFFQNLSNEAFFRKRRIGLGRHYLLPGSGVNLDRYKPLPYPEENAPISFLFISRVLREKGIDQFLGMAQVIHAEYSNTEFHILGFCEDDDNAEDSYRKQIAALEEKGVVKFEGMLEDITPLLVRSQCTVHPSFYPEGMSNVCLESAASARPVITTRHPGCQETVEDGVTGFLVETENTEDLIQKVRAFLQLPYEKRREMGLAGRKKMEQEFDRAIIVKKYQKVVRKLANARNL